MPNLSTPTIVPSPLYPPAISSSVMASNPTPDALRPSSYTFHTNFTGYTAPSDNERHDLSQAITPMRQSLFHTSSQDTLNGRVSRPSTATVCPDIQTLNQLLPPKRDLPFPKPQAKRSHTMLSRPPTTHIEDIQPRFNTPAPSTDHSQNSRVITLKYRPSSQSQLNLNTKPTSGQMPQIQTLTQPICTPNIPPVTTHHSLFPIQQDEHSLLNQGPVTENPIQEQQHNLRTETDLSAYLACPTVERTMKLENWICKSIEDDGFLQLCEDVEGIWRRFALGK
ncbi:hypothetical protein BDV23DRAFT_151724 [Aspergillus alliaceus]|uniref:Uncharacterized protein n=1 Tax=Petromyces alliaceus TaxID=209559 RepID=A0A5N7CDI3_PETAA|nr:hypothetical protein BDV23DRAFT_151724 [Aspergillus alliaceus]